jgi:hypothetical protein
LADPQLGLAHGLIGRALILSVVLLMENSPRHLQKPTV